MKQAYFKPKWFTLNFDARALSMAYFKPQRLTLAPVTVRNWIQGVEEYTFPAIGYIIVGS